MEHIQKEVLMRHAEAFDKVTGKKALKTGGEYKWRAKGEYHMFNPESIYKLQMACRTGNYKLYKEYAREMDEHQQHLSGGRRDTDRRGGERREHSKAL